MGMQDSNSDEIKTVKTATAALASYDRPATNNYDEGPLPTTRPGMFNSLLNIYVYIERAP